MLVTKYMEEHWCPGATDIFSGWCFKCNGKDLAWIRKEAQRFELTESYGLPHTCEQEEPIQGIDKAKCKFCHKTDLLWVKQKNKFTLTETTGLAHSCPLKDPFYKDWSEAIKDNYAFEKKWINSIPDEHKCKKCDGTGLLKYLCRNKRLLIKYQTDQAVQVSKGCKKCKRIGHFTKLKKTFYLKELRKRYWPFKGGIHKWKKYDNG